MANVAIQNRWDCQAFWHYEDAEFTLVEGSDPQYWKLVRWPDVKGERLLNPSNALTAKRSYNHCVEVNAGNVSLNLVTGTTYTSGAFTIYVVSEGQPDDGNQGVITWGGASIRFIDNVLTATDRTTTVTGGSSGEPIMSHVVAYTNAPHWPLSNKLYVDGVASGSPGLSTPAATLSSAVVSCFPNIKPRIYKAIALFNNYHTSTEVAAISAALLSRGLVPEPERLTVTDPPSSAWVNFDLEVEPITPAFSRLELEVATPDYCTYPTGDA